MTQSAAAERSAELSFAIDIALRAGEIALAHFHRGIEATMKADNTPVTAADRDCERLIRESIAQHFPDDGILGEEEGETAPSGTSVRRWIIDPIDGTYNFARQVPIWSVLLGLEEKGDLIAGVLHAPAMAETYWAEKGRGAWKNGSRLHVSDISDVSKSMFVFGAPDRIVKQGLWGGLERVIKTTYRQRGFGDYLNFAHVFQGQAEAAFEVGLKPWDLAPMKIIVEEAGGRYSDLHGGTSIYTGGCLVSNGLVHDQILQLLLG
jgi:histidinol-phosphatase